MKTRTIFKNRWWAVLWAVGIMWAVYDFMGVSPDIIPDVAGNSAANASADEQLAQIANAMNGLKPPTP